MLNILRSILVLFDTVLQILLRLGGMTKGEKRKLRNRIDDLENDIDKEGKK
jgi:hypothetical protein